MDTEKTSAHVKTHLPHHWVFGQRALALANRSVHSSSRGPFSFPNQIFSLSAGQRDGYLFTSAPACLIPCFHRSVAPCTPPSLSSLHCSYVHIPPTPFQTSFILAFIDPSRSIQPSAPLSLHQSICPSLFFSFSLLKTNTPQVGLSPSSISLPALPADSVFAQGLGRALCH